MTSALPPIPGLNPLLDPLPAHLTTARPHQITAVMEILEAFNRGEKVVVLDCPTGGGKSWIAAVTRLMLQTNAVYLAHARELQIQFNEAFADSPILWGRSNYLPEHTSIFPGADCGDCTFQAKHESCALCDGPWSCPYQMAKNEAVKSSIPVLNFAYWLNEVRGERSHFKARGLTVIDECDEFEKTLMGQISVSISENAVRKYKISPPDRMTKEESYVDWGRTTISHLAPMLRSARRKLGSGHEATRRVLFLENLLSKVRGMVEDLEAGRCQWVYAGGAGSDRRRGDGIEFKPVTVETFGMERIWDRGERFLLMSGTVISSSMLLEGLGWNGTHALVTVDSQFPARNRQVIVRPAADMGRKSQEENGTVAPMTRALEKISREYPGQSILVHTVSFALAQRLAEGEYGARDVITYTGSPGSRTEALERFKQTPGSILLAPSMDRGIDLPDDQCRVQVLVKVPFPNLGDKQTSERLYRTKNGKLWYQVQVARSIVQMAGRGVRHKDDWCVVVVLDSGFSRWYREWQLLLPVWFRRAIRFERG